MVCQCSIGRWVRGNVIGAGSFGKVHLAINVGTGELFAVKSIDCSSSAGAEVAAMENELSFLQSLDSPFIVKCFGGDQTLENGVQMRNLFMEYMAGGSLADLMKVFGGALDEALIRVYTRGILQGLSYLHSQRVVHCDVKGRNVLIGASGLKIADFGSAKRVGQEEDAVMRGTPLWMAPEVLMNLEQGPPSDVWSLGCTIVEMATGRPPWSLQGFNLLATLLRIGSKQDMPPYPDSLSAEGKDFLSKCLQRDPKQRWTTAQLLNHPFVQVQAANPEIFAGVNICAAEEEEEGMTVPPSPTSVLDVGTDTDGGTWHTNQPACRRAPLLHYADADQKALLRPGSEKGSGRCFTVRSPRVGSGERQSPLSAMKVPLSPTSVLDVGTDTGSGTWQTIEPAGIRIPLPHCPDADQRAPTSVSMAAEEGSGMWITVRSPRVGSGERQRPLSEFMLGRGEKSMVNGGVLNVASLHFLRPGRGRRCPSAAIAASVATPGIASATRSSPSD